MPKKGALGCPGALSGASRNYQKGVNLSNLNINDEAPLMVNGLSVQRILNVEVIRGHGHEITDKWLFQPNGRVSSFDALIGWIPLLMSENQWNLDACALKHKAAPQNDYLSIDTSDILIT